MPDTSEIVNRVTDTAILNKRLREERFFMDSLEFGINHQAYIDMVKNVNPDPIIGRYRYFLFGRHDFHGWLYGVDIISVFMPDSKYETELKDRMDNLCEWVEHQYGKPDVSLEMPPRHELKTDSVVFLNRWYAGEKRIEIGIGKIGGEIYYAIAKIRHRRRWIDFLLSRNVSTVSSNLKKMQRNYLPPFDHYYMKNK